MARNPKKHPRKNVMESKYSGFHELMEARKSWSDKMADFLTNYFGTIGFFILNAALFTLWILVNENLIPGIQAFDPFPYGLLTMAVSLEAIFLSIIVLISQNKASLVADLREELDLEVNLWAEEEITKILNIVDAIHDHLGLPPEDDRELKSMKKKTDINKMERKLLKQYGRTNL